MKHMQFFSQSALQLFTTLLVVFSIMLCDIVNVNAAESYVITQSNSYEYVPAYKNINDSSFTYPTYDYGDVGIDVYPGTYQFLMQFKPELPVQSGTYDICWMIDDASDYANTLNNIQLVIFDAASKGIVSVSNSHIVKKKPPEGVSTYDYIYFDDIEIPKDAYIIRIVFNCSFSKSYAVSFYSRSVTFDPVDVSEKVEEEQLQATNNIFDAIGNFFGSFFDNLISAIAGVFIPEDGFFEDFFARLNDFFSEKLGMLWTPIDMLVDILNAILDANETDATIVFPELKYQEYVLVPETPVDIRTYLAEIDGLQDTIYFVTNVSMIGAIIVLLQVKLKEVFSS